VITDRLPAFGVPPTAAPRGRRGMVARALARPSLPALGTLLVMVVVFAFHAPGLLTAGGLAGVLDVASVLGIGGVAVALLLIGGQFDLSIGVVGVAGALVAALLIGEAGWGVWPALLVSLACALVVGLVNGLLVVNLGLPSFLVTVATFLILQGTAVAGSHVIAGRTTIGSLDEAPGWASAAAVFGGTLQLGDGRFRVSVLWWLAATVLASWVLWRTRFGNAILAAGGARRAARELGVAVRRTTVALFCLSAVAGWLIGTLSLVRLGGVQVAPALGSEIEFIVVAVIGGCLLTGGYGSAFGASVGALIYGVAWQGIPLAGWDQRWFRALLGGLLLLALVANGVVRRRLKAVPRS
jgi:simple sugar transport system permease protein